MAATSTWLLHVVELARAGGGVAQDYLGERGFRVAAAWFRDEEKPGHGVIGEVCADAGKVGDRLDAQKGQRGRRADA